MPNASEFIQSVKLDDTSTPDHVLEAVEAMRAEGKMVSLKMSQADYNRLMCMPHEERLEFAKRVMADKERKAVAKVAGDKAKRDRKGRKARRRLAQRKGRK